MRRANSPSSSAMRTDRIVALVDRMEAFSEHQLLARAALNIHEVLERVRRIAQSAFARHVAFRRGLRPVAAAGSRQSRSLGAALLNLVKNAAEASPAKGGEIVLATGYRHGRRLTTRNSGPPLQVPLMVSDADNGLRHPDDLRAHLFEPFGTTKRNGTGLGLALVAKVIGDHGGIIEFDSQPRRTVFRVFLPVVPPFFHGTVLGDESATILVADDDPRAPSARC